MKKLAILVPVFFVAACETAPTGPLAVDQFIGKELVGPNATFLFNADGTVGGTFRDDPIVGTYVSTATEICSTYTAPENFIDLGEVCSTPAVSNGTVVFNRRDGSKSAEYTIGG